jgi:hypothetical protein
MPTQRQVCFAFAPESLERRTHLSVAVQNGKVEIVGTEGDDVITVSGGGSALLVNGAPVAVPGGIRNIDIVSLGGNDIITVSNLTGVTGSLDIDSGEGADQVRVQNVSVGDDVQVDTGGGNDLLRLDVVTAEDQAVVDTGTGDDLLQFTRFTVGSRVRISLDDGDDDLIIGNVTAPKRVTLDGDAGDDAGFIVRTTIFTNQLQIKDFERVVPPLV